MTRRSVHARVRRTAIRGAVLFAAGLVWLLVWLLDKLVEAVTGSPLPVAWVVWIVAAVLLAVVVAPVGWVGFRVVRWYRGRVRPIPAVVEAADQLTGPEFEQIVGALLRRDGYTGVRAGGGGGDLGCDVSATSPDGLRVVVQCKRYAEDNPVGNERIQTFLGTCWDEHHADIAMIVTTGWFTDPAWEYGSRRGLVLVDRPRLADWMAGKPLRVWQGRRSVGFG